MEITKSVVDGCKPGPSFGDPPSCFQKYMYARPQGVLKDATQIDVTKQCYTPNAGIAWKQPNGFYYPPAFHSTNLFFDNTDIRHFVVEPLFQLGTYLSDNTAQANTYCKQQDLAFANFTDVDRQTELNDDDGSMTGLLNTVSVNEDPFFNAPRVP